MLETRNRVQNGVTLAEEAAGIRTSQKDKNTDLTKIIIHHQNYDYDDDDYAAFGRPLDTYRQDMEMH